VCVLENDSITSDRPDTSVEERQMASNTAFYITVCVSCDTVNRLHDRDWHITVTHPYKGQLE